MSFNLRNLQVQTGFSPTAPAINWVGKIHLSWDEGMFLDDPNYYFQVRRSSIQPIISENVWWASECCFSKRASSMDGSYDYTTTSVNIFNQNRTIGRTVAHGIQNFLNLATPLSTVT